MRLWLFFASRRRHTRSLCDWSSDVCSSDLWDRDDKARVIYVTHEDLKAGRKSSLLSDAEIIMVYAGYGEATPCVRPSNSVNGDRKSVV